MSGSILLLLLTVFMQNTGDVLPNSNRPNLPTYPGAGQGGTPNLLPNSNLNSSSSGMPDAPATVGWGPDRDGKFCMIIQIAPEALGVFARGPSGEELTALVPESIRARVEKIIIRVGVEPVERINPTATMSSALNTAPPMISTIDGRNSFPIDPSRNDTYRNNNESTLANNNRLSNLNNGPNTNQNNAPILPDDLGGRPVNSPVGTNLPPSNGLGGYNTSTGNQPPLNQLNDDFRGTQPTGKPSSFDFLDRNNRSNNSGYPPLYSNTTTTPNSRPNLASNPLGNGNVPPNGYDPNINSNTVPYTGIPSTTPSPTLSQLPPGNLGNYPTTPNSPYAPTNTTFGSNIPTFASRPNTPPSYPPADPLPPDDSLLARERLLPFLLLFSIVGNVYLGLWMSHLRSRYKQLLANLRGVPVSSLDP